MSDRDALGYIAPIVRQVDPKDTEIKRLRELLGKAERDAKRYQYIKDAWAGTARDEWDEKIDAAMSSRTTVTAGKTHD